MLYIKKLNPSQEIIDEINRVKRTSSINTPKEAAAAFDSLRKDSIRENLIKEQHGLCAYCMKRIRKDKMIIEHYKPKSEHFNLTLDYKNMLGVCSGGRDKNEEKKLCCEASKGNQEIKINPLSRIDMDKIRYKSDGTIYTYPKDEDFEHDINEILRLNGERDENGNLMHDTSTELVKGRQDVYKNLYDKFIKGLRSRNKLTPKNLEKKIHELEEEETYEEYAGVLLYFLKRDLKRYGRYSQKTQNIML